MSMATKTAVHSTLVTRAAKNVLRPLGLFQKGSSRTWLGDHEWWMEVVEFQPSGWSKGSYLNVGCMWLWNVKSTISFDEGYRAVGFQSFENEEQFKSVAEMLARQAEERIIYFRTQFPTIRAVSDHYRHKAPLNSFWPIFNAAIAHGLCGRCDSGARLLESMAGTLDLSIEWQKDADKDARYLAGEIRHPQRFRQLIFDRILQARKLQKLSSLTTIDFDTAN